MARVPKSYQSFTLREGSVCRIYPSHHEGALKAEAFVACALRAAR